MHVADTILREPADVYHANAKTHLTSHALGDFRRCPLLYRKKKLGLVEDEDRPAYLVGRALHTLVLEGRETFEREFAVGGPVNPKTGELFGATTKAFAEWAAAQGKPVLTLQQFDLIEKMAEGVRQNGIARDLLSEGIAEGVVRRDYRQMPSQARMDFFDPHRGIVDLKTCDDPQRAGADGCFRTVANASVGAEAPTACRGPRLVRGRCASLRVRPPGGLLPGRAVAGNRLAHAGSPRRCGKEGAVPLGRLEGP